MKSKEIAVFFDGSCPLCSREINHYQNMRGSETIEWIDISISTSELRHYGLEFSDAMARFHVIDRNNQWHTGVYGFVRLWQQLRVMKPVARILQFFHLLPVLDWMYGKFANWRLQHHCDSSSCNPGNSYSRDKAGD